MRRWASSHVAFALVGSLFASAVTANAVAAPSISGTSPPKVRIDRLGVAIRILGDGFLPSGVTACSDDAVKRIKIQYRGELDEPFKDADLIFPSSLGCGANGIVGYHFNFTKSPPSVFQVRVLVDGIASNIRGIPLVPNPITGAPTITSITPSAGAVGWNYAPLITLSGTNIPADAKVRFQGQYLASSQSVSETGWLQFNVPKEKLANQARYSVQLESSKGYSNFAWYDVIAKPVITQVAPAAIPTGAYAQQSAPLPVSVYHTGSEPKNVRAQLGTAWLTITNFTVKPGLVQFSLPLAGKAIPQNLPIRFSNDAGDNTFVVPIATTTKTK